MCPRRTKQTQKTHFRHVQVRFHLQKVPNPPPETGPPLSTANEQGILGFHRIQRGLGPPCPPDPPLPPPLDICSAVLKSVGRDGELRLQVLVKLKSGGWQAPSIHRTITAELRAAGEGTAKQRDGPGPGPVWWGEARAGVVGAAGLGPVWCGQQSRSRCNLTAPTPRPSESRPV